MEGAGAAGQAPGEGQEGICTGGNAHREMCSGWLSESRRGPERGTPVWVTPREAAACPRSWLSPIVPRCFLRSALIWELERLGPFLGGCPEQSLCGKVLQ